MPKQYRDNNGNVWTYSARFDRYSSPHIRGLFTLKQIIDHFGPIVEVI